MLLKFSAVWIVLVTSMFAQVRDDNEIRTYVSDDGQRLQVNSRGQILGFENAKACDSPKCLKIGIGLWAMTNEGVKLFLGNGRFATNAPPSGRVNADEGVTVNVELDVMGAPGLEVQITWKPRSNTAGIHVIAARLFNNLVVNGAEGYVKGRGGRATAGAARIPIPLGLSFGCECDVPTGYLPPFTIRASFGGAPVSERVPPTGFLADRFAFLKLSEIVGMKPGDGDPFSFELIRNQ